MGIDAPATAARPPLRRRRTLTVVLAAALVTVAAFVALTVLQDSSAAKRDAEVKLSRVQVQLGLLQGLPYRADGTYGATAQEVRRSMDAAEGRIDSQLAELRSQSPSPHLAPAAAAFAENREHLEGIRRVFAALPSLSLAEGSAHIAENAFWIRDSVASNERMTAELDAAGADYHADARRAIDQTRIAGGGVLLALLAGFSLFYVRSTRAHAATEVLALENERLLSLTRHEAATDSLTGLGNRRALVARLDSAMPGVSEERPLALAMFDLDGFKYYNDSFGHPAGDALLSRLATRLRESVDGRATAFRVGGDEFCLLADAGCAAVGEIAATAAEALSEDGDGFSIGCSYGVAVAPFDAASSAQALGVADQRMYESKESSRTSAGLQSKDVLLQVLNERDGALRVHIHDVADSAERTAARLGVADQELRRIRLAAELHDVGKAAIPDSILSKPGRLTPQEWDFMRKHSLIGERIVGSAPALADSAAMIRAVHERIDGGGYPDGLRGEQIPLGARVIAVCDAFDAMTSKRPYRTPLEATEALAELRRCAGTQFDPAVVAAFVEVHAGGNEGEADPPPVSGLAAA